jgi:chromosome segregation ATPase
MQVAALEDEVKNLQAQVEQAENEESIIKTEIELAARNDGKVENPYRLLMTKLNEVSSLRSLIGGIQSRIGGIRSQIGAQMRAENRRLLSVMDPWLAGPESY